MTYLLENINSTIAKIAECLARDPKRAERLLRDLQKLVRQLAEDAPASGGTLPAIPFGPAFIDAYREHYLAWGEQCFDAGRASNRLIDVMAGTSLSTGHRPIASCKQTSTHLATLEGLRVGLECDWKLNDAEAKLDALDAAISKLREAGEPAKRDWTAINAAIEEYVGGYELRADPGNHTPTEFEQFLILDAIHGLLAEDDFLSLMSAAPQASADRHIASLKGQVTKLRKKRGQRQNCGGVDGR